jgi:hypothetical protein
MHAHRVPRALVGLIGAIAACTAVAAGQDTDGDGVIDTVDNCRLVQNPLQQNRDLPGKGDIYGNACDPDYNGDLQTTAADYLILRGKLNTSDPAIDLNGDGKVSAADYLILRARLNQPPGPAGAASVPLDPVSEQPWLQGEYRVLAANDLGMHCADTDQQVFSILPPFNVVHAQVVRRGTASAAPVLMDNATPATTIGEVLYSAVSHTRAAADVGQGSEDPVLDPSHPTLPAGLNPPVASLLGTDRAAVSINSTSQNDPGAATAGVDAGVLKTDFWDGVPPLGFFVYDNLFFGLLLPTDLARDTGMPVPDSILLRACLQGYLSGTATAEQTRIACAFGQQAMPGAENPYRVNQPQPFGRFDRDVNFFNELLGASGLGAIIADVNWWAADGVPIMPVDDAGRINAYPLMRVQAKKDGVVVATTDVVLPVASEADCQNCHVDPLDCADPRLPQRLLLQSDACTGAAVADMDPSRVVGLDEAPGVNPEQRLLNAAKINIMRLHDQEHGSSYPAGWGPGEADADSACTSATDEDCLDNLRPIQCSQCHYSPALDLAQLGPQTSPPSGVFQVRSDGQPHPSMSAVMHGHHGSLPADPALPYDPETNALFATMPPPTDSRRTSGAKLNDFERATLAESCYQCHPGKRTQCLRGAMFSAGIVCQDCHGQMTHVGADFTNGGTRVSWASEPKCQSCHTGDALAPNHPAGATVSPTDLDGNVDNIRLLQAYTANPNQPTQSAASRFAENQTLYRLSTGHGGVMCEGCHGSTHSEWPVQPEVGAFVANDNLAAVQLQGHAGTITECTTCHEPTNASLPLSLGGPHGMHPVADFNGRDQRWNTRHENAAESNPAACQACHGVTGQGTVLSRTAKTRLLRCKDADGSLCGAEDQLITVAAGTPIGCAQCHENEIGGGD